jgi:alpha-beta hydrolase superfamily lysophospholipase
MKWMRRIAIGAIVVVVVVNLFFVGAAYYGAGKMEHPQWMRPAPRKNPKAAFGLNYEDVSFRTEDGATLRGWFVPAGQSEVGVVTVHGAGANRSEFLSEAKILHDAGYPVLLFDCRGHGASDEVGRGISLGAREHRDVEAAVSYARQSRGMKRVVVLGCSQGAASSIEAAGEDKEIDGVIAEASFLEPDEVLEFATHKIRPDLKPWFVTMMCRIAVWRMGGSGMPGPVDAVAKISPRPVLLMQGSADEMVPPHDVQILYDHASDPKVIWIGDGAGHCQLADKYPDQYRARILDFMSRYFPLDSHR